MSRLAIVIGCSRYSAPESDLPAAANDALAIATLLEATGSYDHVLRLIDPPSAAEAKQILSAFVRDHRDGSTEEVLLYFSGHGLFKSEEFYYVFRTYDELKPRETCLENAELDDMLRALSPELTVKIVDACNAGVSYVKSTLQETRPLQKHLNATQGKFSKCYFLFSSYRDQSSYADRKLSYFTRALLESIASRELGPIRYKDLVSATADFFAGDPNQRPFFVIQADQTEEFLSLTEPLKSIVVSALSAGTPVSAIFQVDPASQLVGALKHDAARYTTQEGAVSRLEGLREFLLSQATPGPLRDLYETECVTGSGKGRHPGADYVGEWLRRYGADVMAKPTYKFLAEAQTMVDKVVGNIPRQYESSDVESYEPTVEVPFTWIELRAKEKLPNLHRFTLLITPLLTRADAHIFGAVVEYGHRTWTEFKLLEEPTWNNVKAALAPQDGVTIAVKVEVRRLWDAVAKYAVSAANMKKDDAENFIRLVRESG